MRLANLVARRLVLLPISLFVLVTLSFGLVELMPGNPAVAIAGTFANEERIAEIEQELGLDEPLWNRYVDYLASAVQGDLGTSFFTGQPVRSELLQRLPATIEMIGLALVFAGLVGLVLGGVGAYFRRTWYDKASRFSITIFQSIPDFLLALFLIFFLFFLWGIAPAPVGRLGLSSGSVDRITGLLLVDTLVAGQFDLFLQALRHLFLPVVALGIVYSAYFGKTARSTMATALESPQVEFARAMGLPEWQVIRYAFVQARTPILTYGAILFGALVGGAAIVETIFSWQGAGAWALDAILKLDIPVIQGFILAAGVVTILVYLLLDVVTLILDPRVRLRGDR